MQYGINLFNDLLAKPSNLRASSKYMEIDGLMRLLLGALLIVGPLLAQTVGRRSGGEQVVAASVVDRLVFVPLVLVPLAIAGVFPHLLLAFAFLDVTLAIVAWGIVARGTYSKTRHASLV